MKKILTLVAAAVMALAANATDYTDDLAITLNGVPTAPATAKITVTPVDGSDGLYDIVLNQFTFANVMLIGDVTIEDVKANSTDGGDGYAYFEPITKEAAITNGSSIAEMLENKVTVTIKEGSKMNDKNLYLIINLPVVIEQLEQDFNVDAVFGTGGYQLPNSGFENFHTATYKNNSSDEPNAWHSFMSCTGIFAGFVSSTPHTFIAEEGRTNSLGSRSVRIVSGLALASIPANGTMTTGQMQAGAMSASDPANCAFLNIENTAVDGNGDPFYTLLNGQPDSLSVWVKFKQGQDLGENKYATVSAVITDGTYYQDPEDPEETYTNVVAKAQNAQIESKDFTWQRISIPFDYDTYASNGAATKAILVTISTNAQPGVGSKDADNPDELYVDDIEFIYNAGLSKLAYNGTEVALEEGKYEYEIEDLAATNVTVDQIEAVSDGRGAYVTTTVNPTPNGYKAITTVISNDFKTINTYTLNINNVTTGINSVENAADNTIEAIYNISGQRINEMQKGVNIVRMSDGTTVKVLKK